MIVRVGGGMASEQSKQDCTCVNASMKLPEKKSLTQTFSTCVHGFCIIMYFYPGLWSYLIQQGSKSQSLWEGV